MSRRNPSLSVWNIKLSKFHRWEMVFFGQFSLHLSSFWSTVSHLCLTDNIIIHTHLVYGMHLMRTPRRCDSLIERQYPERRCKHDRFDPESDVAMYGDSSACRWYKDVILIVSSAVAHTVWRLHATCYSLWLRLYLTEYWIWKKITKGSRT